MAAARPQSLDAMRGLHGIGQIKLERHGAAFLNLILRHRAAAE
jgi:superfamily II DNA helicase RecQ